MRNLNIRGIAVAALVAAGAILAGCSGGGVKSLPPSTTPVSNQMAAPTTMTFMIGSVAQSAQRSAKYIPASTQSIVVKYQGDSSATPPTPGGANPPATAPTAATVNVTTTGSNPPPPGQCVAVGSAYQCTVTVSFPIGVLDIYILAYSGTNGSGTLLASSVSILQVNLNGTLTAPGTTTPAVAPTALSGNISAPNASVTLGAAIALTPPNQLPIPNATPTSVAVPAGLNATLNGPFFISAASTPTYTANDGTTIPSNSPITPITVTDGDTTGNTCLVYIKQGASSATPCPLGSPNSVTLSNSSDSYAVLYNNKFIPAATFNITATVPSPGPSTTPAPQKVNVTTTDVVNGNTVTLPRTNTCGAGAANCTGSGAIVYDIAGSAIYTGTTDQSSPVLKIPYSTSTGYGTTALRTPTLVNGGAATTLTAGGAGSAVIGPDNNIWFTETSAATAATVYVGVLLANASGINPTNGATVAAGATSYLEYALKPAVNSILVSIASNGGFIWVTDNQGQMWRINPATAFVNPNLAAGYAAGAAATSAVAVTTAGAGGMGGAFDTDLVSIGSNLFSGIGTANKIVKLTLDTSPAPSAGVCTAAGPPPCIAAATVSGNATSGAPNTLATDGTNVYVVDANKALYQYTTSLIQTPAAAVSFTGTLTGGLYAPTASPTGQWFWTAITAGASNIKSMTTTTASAAVTTNNCGTQFAMQVGSNGFVLGPDLTLLQSQVLNTAGTGNAGLCGIIY